jgi:hypothetical protein
MKLYSARRHEREISALSEEYDRRLKDLQAALAELKEENRRLSAEISVLRAQKQSISDAMIAASEKREEMQEETEAYFASQRAMALQAAEKAQRLLDDVRASYPDEAVGSRFKAFERRLKALLSPNEEEAAERSEILDEISSGLSSEEASEIHTELTFSEEPSLPADGEWDLKEVLETLGLSDD